MKFKVGLLIAILLSSGTAAARVFNFKQEKMAAYFNVTGGGSTVGKSTVKNEALAGMDYSGNVNYNYSGEFGFLAAFDYFNLKVGFEVLKPTALDSASAKNAGVEQYSFDSSMFGYAYKAALDINLHRMNTNRSYVSLGVGMATMELKNSYSLTAAGQGQFPGVVDHEVKAGSSAIMYTAAAGYEAHFADTTTFVFEFGYRHLPMNEWKYKGSGTTFSGAYSSGDKVETIDGKAREIDLSGGYVSLGFRFYL